MPYASFFKAEGAMKMPSFIGYNPARQGLSFEDCVPVRIKAQVRQGVHLKALPHVFSGQPLCRQPFADQWEEV
jgi:hypothetical protein